MHQPRPRQYAAQSALAFFLSAFCAIVSASAQDWPSRPLTLVVGFPAGGADDAVARLMAPRLAEKLGQSCN